MPDPIAPTDPTPGVVRDARSCWAHHPAGSQAALLALLDALPTSDVVVPVDAGAAPGDPEHATGRPGRLRTDRTAAAAHASVLDGAVRSLITWWRALDPDDANPYGSVGRELRADMHEVESALVPRVACWGLSGPVTTDLAALAEHLPFRRLLLHVRDVPGDTLALAAAHLGSPYPLEPGGGELLTRLLADPRLPESSFVRRLVPAQAFVPASVTRWRVQQMLDAPELPAVILERLVQLPAPAWSAHVYAIIRHPSATPVVWQTLAGSRSPTARLALAQGPHEAALADETVYALLAERGDAKVLSWLLHHPQRAAWPRVITRLASLDPALLARGLLYQIRRHRDATGETPALPVPRPAMAAVLHVTVERAARLELTQLLAQSVAAPPPPPRARRGR